MSLAEGMQIADNRRQRAFNNSMELRNQNRKDLQLQAKLAQNGMTASGGLTEAQQIKEQLLQEQLQAQKQQLQAVQAKFNADGVTNILDSVVQGNWHDAYKVWNTTPGLKEALASAPTLDVKDISPVNYNDPNDVEQLKGMGISKLDDKEVQDALNSSFMKIQGHDGKWRVVPVDSIVKETNTWNMFSKQQQENYTKRAQYINSVLQGKNPELAARQEEVTTKTAELQTKSAEMQLANVEKWLKDNPGKTIKDYENQNSTSGLKDTKLALEIQKLNQEVTKKVLDNKDKIQTNEAKEKKKEVEVTEALQLVDTLLKHPGREWATGATFLSSYIPGTDAKDFASLVDTLKANAFLESIKSMKGFGALSDKEGAKLELAISNLDLSQSEESFIKSLNTMKETFKKIKANSGKEDSKPVIAVNPNTGEKLQLVNGKWEPIK